MLFRYALSVSVKFLIVWIQWHTYNLISTPEGAFNQFSQTEAWLFSIHNYHLTTLILENKQTRKKGQQSDAWLLNAQPKYTILYVQL